jgi:phosphatidylglycerol:prolipoprotein diacylglycerol transferase
MHDAAGHWVHDLDPILVRFTDSIAIHWYGISYLIGIAWGWWMLRRWARAGRFPIPAAAVADFATTIAIGMIVGGRLGYCILYAWPELAANPLFFFQVWNGGMASHGGMVGMLAAAWWYAWRRKLDLLVLGDALTAVGPFGIACGRAANFVNGELWGKPWDGSWAVIFPNAERAPDGMTRDQLLAWCAVNGTPRHASQLYAVALEGLIPLAILLPIHARHRRPGLTVGMFCILYAIGRIVGEIFRMPDAFQPGYDAAHPAFFGLFSKGQLFSLPLIALGIWLVARALRRPPAEASRYLAPTGN